MMQRVRLREPLGSLDRRRPVTAKGSFVMPVADGGPVSPVQLV
jgi:hypothetical protein